MEQPTKQAGCAVVVGGGVAGLSTALHLALQRTFSRIIVLDRASIGRNISGACASTVNAGIVFVEGNGAVGRDPEERLFTQLCYGTKQIFRELQQNGPLDIELVEGGCLLVARTEEEAQHVVRDVEGKRAVGMNVEMLSGEEVRRMAPVLAADVRCGYWLPDGATCHPQKVTEALALRARAAGVNLWSHHTVDAIVPFCAQADHGRQGWRITGVAPATGRFSVDADTLVIAAGAISERVGRFISPQAAKCVPVIPVLGQMWCTPPQDVWNFRFTLGAYESRVDWRKLPPLVPPHVTRKSLRGERLTRHMYGKQSCDRCFVFGGDRRVAVSTKPDGTVEAHQWPQLIEDGLQDSKRHVAELVPCVADLSVVRSWSGLMPFSPDGSPIIGRIVTHDTKTNPNAFAPVFACTGFGSDGFMCGPMAGKMLAEMIHTGFAPDVLEPADPQRFLDKSHEHSSKL